MTVQSYAESPSRALSSTSDGVLGRMLGVHSDPELEDLPRFDDQVIEKLKEGDNTRSATYSVTRGDDRGITLTFNVVLSEDEEVYTDITVHTRCG